MKEVVITVVCVCNDLLHHGIQSLRVAARLGRTRSVKYTLTTSDWPNVRCEENSGE